uniref:Uncharacterized protein n=1 Tax=Oryza barthii TaxID=65489 RepID=A0A0D3G4N2_9ORYZ
MAACTWTTNELWQFTAKAQYVFTKLAKRSIKGCQAQLGAEAAWEFGTAQIQSLLEQYRRGDRWTREASRGGGGVVGGGARGTEATHGGVTRQGGGRGRVAEEVARGTEAIHGGATRQGGGLRRQRAMEWRSAEEHGVAERACWRSSVSSNRIYAAFLN